VPPLPCSEGVLSEPGVQKKNAPLGGVRVAPWSVAVQKAPHWEALNLHAVGTGMTCPVKDERIAPRHVKALIMTVDGQSPLRYTICLK
jgi:hypothetical protein